MSSALAQPEILLPNEIMACIRKKDFTDPNLVMTLRILSAFATVLSSQHFEKCTHEDIVGSVFCLLSVWGFGDCVMAIRTMDVSALVAIGSTCLRSPMISSVCCDMAESMPFGENWARKRPASCSLPPHYDANDNCAPDAKDYDVNNNDNAEQELPMGVQNILHILDMSLDARPAFDVSRRISLATQHCHDLAQAASDVPKSATTAELWFIGAQILARVNADPPVPHRVVPRLLSPAATAHTCIDKRAFLSLIRQCRCKRCNKHKISASK